jgi:dihydropyrimidinase
MDNKSLLIRDGTVVSDSCASQIDLYVQSGRIVAQGARGSFDREPFTEVIEASGMYVLPGLIDPHVHFDSPFMGSKTVHDFRTGSIAAAYGGITTVISFSTQGKGESIIKNIESQNRNAEKQSYIDWGFHGIVLDAKEDTLSEIQQLINAGYPTYKCFTTYRHSDRMVEDRDILSLLEVTARNNAMLMVHCENDAILEYNLKSVLATNTNNLWVNHAKSRPASAENVEIARIIDLMREEIAPVYIVHTSTRESMGIIQDAIDTGLPIHCETCTHYLVLTEDKMKEENGYQFICSPPLRKKEDNDALWKAAINGPLEVVSTDDAGVPTSDRIKFGEGRFDKVPNGMPGIEPRLAILYSQGVVKGRINLPRLVALTATNPAKLFGLFPQKGHLGIGADADIVIFDPNPRGRISASTHHMNTDFSPFEGMEVTGTVRSVLCRGEFVIREGELVGTPGYGKLVRRSIDRTWLKRS